MYITPDSVSSASGVSGCLGHSNKEIEPYVTVMQIENLPNNYGSFSA